MSLILSLNAMDAVGLVIALGLAVYVLGAVAFAHVEAWWRHRRQKRGRGE